jgi:C4-dicarboxylate-specific signal transduction histidine kinase
VIENRGKRCATIPFFTTKSHGHGVGLALAHRVITEHGGTLSATNASEGGAAFIVRMRVMDAPGTHASGVLA